MSLTPRLDRLSENLIINGGLDFWQRNTSLVISAAASDKNYLADRWSHTSFFASGTKTVSRSVDVPAGTNATYSMQTEMTTTVSVSHPSTNFHANAGVYRMEGLDALRLHGKTVTLQFWVKSTLTGLYSVAFGNNYDASSYKYVSTYTVNAANTWEQKSVTLEMTPAIVSNFAKDNTQGFFIAFGIAANVNGSRITSSLNQWLGPTSGALIASTANRTDFLTAGNSIRIAQVKLSIGSGISDFSFAGRTYSDELTMCQRYYEKSYDIDVFAGSLHGGYPFGGQALGFSGIGSDDPIIGYGFSLQVPKRATPVPIIWSPNNGATNTVYIYRSVGSGSSGNLAISGIISGTKLINFSVNQTINTGCEVYFAYTADAEL
jgi:hypothetical protein